MGEADDQEVEGHDKAMKSFRTEGMGYRTWKVRRAESLLWQDVDLGRLYRFVDEKIGELCWSLNLKKKKKCDIGVLENKKANSWTLSNDEFPLESEILNFTVNPVILR